MNHKENSNGGSSPDSDAKIGRGSENLAIVDRTSPAVVASTNSSPSSGRLSRRSPPNSTVASSAWARSTTSRGFTPSPTHKLSVNTGNTKTSTPRISTRNPTSPKTNLTVNARSDPAPKSISPPPPPPKVPSPPKRPSPTARTPSANTQKSPDSRGERNTNKRSSPASRSVVSDSSSGSISTKSNRSGVAKNKSKSTPSPNNKTSAMPNRLQSTTTTYKTSASPPTRQATPINAVSPSNDRPSFHASSPSNGVNSSSKKKKSFARMALASDSMIVASTTATSPVCCFCGTDCTCGSDCLCSDELCQCKASRLLHSLIGDGGVPMTPAPSAKSCCSNNTRPASRLGGTDDDDNDAGSPEHGTVDPLAPFQISAMANNNYGGNNTKTNTNNMRRAEFLISGMTCSMCSQAVEKVVRGLAGVREVSISLTTDSAWVVWDDSLSNQQDIVTAIEAIGYDVEDSKVAVALNNVDPTTATTNDSRSSDTRPTAPDDSTTVEERWRRYRQRQNDKVKTRRSAFLWAMVGTLPILTLTMILPHVIPNLFGHRRVEIPVLNHELDLEALVLLLLATPVQFLCGWEFYKMAWYGFLSGRAGMDTLVALGTTASYGYALCGAWKGDEHAAHFFETSAVLIAFVLAGKWMQVAAMQRTSDVLTQLMELRSPTAIKITPHQRPDAEAQHRSFNPLVDPYNEEVVDTDKIVVGDIVKIIRGASIPADGRVMYGEISVDESMVTGESLPVLKTKGSVVLGGTICVESDTGGETDDQHPRANAGAAFVQVSGVGSSTALARIVQLVQQAQTRAVPIQSFADQVSAVFVPAVCTISLVTYLVWYALCSSNVVPAKWYRDELGEDAATFSLMFAIACLVISCPCALGLATPTAVIVGTGVGAKCGVLMKGGAALEIASKVDTVIFDKTGTLTKGVPAVSDFTLLSTYRHYVDHGEAYEDFLLWLLGSLERTSEHPLAKAIVAFAEERLGDALEQNPFVHPSDFRAITGRGASGKIMEKISVAVGNRSFAKILGLEITPQADDCMKRIEEDGKTAILAAVDDIVCLVMGIADELKPDAAASISYLRDVMGVEVWLMTGDNSRTAAAISRKLRIAPNRVISEALPAAKLENVCALQAEGRIVCMVGDGINDAAALAKADVGIGVGTGAEIATEAADMILVKGHVSDVCTALHLSRAIFRRIQWNLLLSLMYNCLGIPIAAGMFYPFVRARLPPTVAALAMALSSVSVVLSSLTLRLYRPPNVMNRSRRAASLTTTAERSISRRNSQDDNELRANLLSGDHLASSELTERIDNRTIVQMEEG